MLNLTPAQILQIIIALLGVMIASTSQLTDLFGPTTTKTIVSVASILMSAMSTISAIITGQASQVKAINDMPGVEKLYVNEKANPTLAALATDPKMTKIEILPGAEKTVEATAKT